MSGKYLSSAKTTSKVGLPTFITVTHPHHPLRGQQLELVRVLQGVDSKLFVRHPEGRCFRIPRDWTDFEDRQAAHPVAPPERLLDISGLREVTVIISSIQNESSSSQTDGENDS